ncbi:MAG: N-acetylneuraminate synthase family protein [Succinivibrio sp.]|nr:N-acetylneuraminate synthase family protein [Succinivibrio sp.]
MKRENHIFDELFVLELANNHWGSVERGLKIIADFSRVVRFNNVRAAIKLQLRDVERFIHQDFRSREDIRYIKKTLQTKLESEDYAVLAQAVKQGGCLTMATPFDEASVELCGRLNLDLIKIASSDLNDWILIEKIALLRKPVIVSTGGSSLKDVDDLVKFFDNRQIPLAINHCVSLYPTEKDELELNQIDFLRERYPGHVIGFSTHERNADLAAAIMIAYAKGARTFERHIDLAEGEHAMTPYCSTPAQTDAWIKGCLKAKAMCGGSGDIKRTPPKREVEYLDALVRGVYAARDLKAGDTLSDDKVYLAIPLQKGQLSCRELMRGEVLLHDVPQDAPIRIDDVDCPYAFDEGLKQLIYARGL